MSRSPLGVGFAEVDEAIWSPTLCPLHFLPLLRSQALWPGFVAALGELQTACHVLWTPQRAVCSGRSVLHSLGKYIFPFAPKPICLRPKCLTQLSEKMPLQGLLVAPSLVSAPRQQPSTFPVSRSMPLLQTFPFPLPATFLPPRASPSTLWFLFSLEAVTKHGWALFKEPLHLPTLCVFFRTPFLAYVNKCNKTEGGSLIIWIGKNCILDDFLRDLTNHC